MADALARTAGAGLWVKDKAGTEYYMSGAVGAEAELEQYMLSQRINVVDALLPDYDRLMNKVDADGKPDVSARKLAEAMRRDALNELCKNVNERRIPPEDQLKFIQSREGFLWFFHRQLCWGAREKGLPQPTLEKAREIIEFEEEKGRQVQRMSEQVSGIGLVGNSTSPLDGRNSSGSLIQPQTISQSGEIRTDITRMAAGSQSNGASFTADSQQTSASLQAK
jgi:hypothetical protein